MTEPVTCHRIRLGSTSIESPAIRLRTWDGIMGLPARRGAMSRLPRIDGGIHPADPMPFDTRPLTLTVDAWDRDPDGLLTHEDGREGELFGNVDTLLGLFIGAESGAYEGLVRLERDMPDGSTRFLRFRPVAAAPMTRGLVFGGSTASYGIVVSGECPNPFWQDETQSTTTIGTGGTELAGNTGNAPIVEMDIEFTGACRVTDDTRGDWVEASGACTVQLRYSLNDRRIVVGGSPADNLITRNRDWFLRVYPGSTLTRSDGAGPVAIAHRTHWV
jgi:hypothetical protein